MSEQSLIERIGETIQLHANAKQVYGDPVERDGTTIIPVAKVQWGFGGGAFGRGAIERGGGGGGARAMPIGFIEMKDGRAEFRAIRDPGSAAALIAIGIAGVLGGMLLSRLKS
ncbi:MAG TPA: spore germination protein GerW family protein [Thermoanaerobaculia bacterium]|nr:spore germination protein GerW family protein [Thermoanaerobaculia bacterium]